MRTCKSIISINICGTANYLHKYVCTYVRHHQQQNNKAHVQTEQSDSDDDDDDDDDIAADYYSHDYGVPVSAQASQALSR